MNVINQIYVIIEWIRELKINTWHKYLCYKYGFDPKPFDYKEAYTISDFYTQYAYYHNQDPHPTNNWSMKGDGTWLRRDAKGRVRSVIPTKGPISEVTRKAFFGEKSD